MTVQKVVDPRLRGLALSALTASEQAGRVAQALHVLDTIALVRADLTREDLSRAAEAVWREFSNTLDPLALAEQALVFTRLAQFVDAPRAVALARMSWRESFDFADDRVKLSWDDVAGVIVLEHPAHFAGGQAQFGFAAVINADRAVSRSFTRRARREVEVSVFRCPCGTRATLLEGYTDEDRERFDASVMHACDRVRTAVSA